MTKTQAKQLVVCVENDGYAVSLEKRKIYVALRCERSEAIQLWIGSSAARRDRVR